MAWVEWREKRQVRELTDRVEIDTIMNGLNGTDTRASVGDMGTLCSEAPFSMSGTWAEYDGTPSLISKSEVYRLDEIRNRIAVRFVAYKKES
jgi:hypothetical protein